MQGSAGSEIYGLALREKHLRQLRKRDHGFNGEIFGKMAKKPTQGTQARPPTTEDLIGRPQ